jgi:ATP-binding cassette subfamily B multidrug efflux pump
MAPVRLLGMLAPAIGQAVSAGERVFEILDASSEVVESPDAKPLASPRGRVEFQNVSFAYFSRYRVLEDVSFVAEPGQVVALLGATGSGKSTIVNLIPRFYDATGGRITVDGCDIRDLTLASLRGTIGIVLQETTLFAASVRENILFGVDGAGEAAELMMQAARQAQAHDFIMAMPDGYETVIGERGATLSGGQKQRIAIARAIAKNPRILILDDATSSVDAATEAQIQLALDNLMRDRTTFVIAHRVSTIQRADLILVLEGGRIVARGTHEDLLAMSPTYAEIFARQALGTEGRN